MSTRQTDGGDKMAKEVDILCAFETRYWGCENAGTIAGPNGQMFCVIHAGANAGAHNEDEDQDWMHERRGGFADYCD